MKVKELIDLIERELEVELDSEQKKTIETRDYFLLRIEYLEENFGYLEGYTKTIKKDTPDETIIKYINDAKPKCQYAYKLIYIL